MNQKCTNCGTVLTGPFCANCGQNARSRRASVTHMLAEATDDVLRFDSKFYRSILHLLIKPGYLSRQFIRGRRASMLPPIRMYLVISLLFFFIFDIPAPNVQNVNVYIGNILVGKEVPVRGQQNFSMISYSKETPIVGVWLNDFLDHKLEPLKTQDPQLVIDRIFNKLEDIVPNILILFMPIFALILKIMYLFKRVLYFDHLIFSLHFQSWLMVMILIIYSLAQYNPWFATMSIILPIYLARAQKVVYQQTYWLVIPKTLFIIIAYIFMLSVTTLLTLLAAIALA